MTGRSPSLSEWIAFVVVLFVVAGLAWLNGRTPEKVARARKPPGGGSAGGGGGMGGAGGMGDQNR